MAKFELSDDGTMDTVVRCTECGQEDRYNFEPGPDADEDADDTDNEAAYDAFVAGLHRAV